MTNDERIQITVRCTEREGPPPEKLADQLPDGKYVVRCILEETEELIEEYELDLFQVDVPADNNADDLHTTKTVSDAIPEGKKRYLGILVRPIGASKGRYFADVALQLRSTLA